VILETKVHDFTTARNSAMEVASLGSRAKMRTKEGGKEENNISAGMK